MHIEPNYELIFNSGSFEEISKGENRFYILAVNYEASGEEISDETLIEIENPEERELLMHADSYLEYYNRKEDQRIGRKKKYAKRFAVKYNFIEKIYDHQNNLIILAEEIGWNLGEGERFLKTWAPVFTAD